MSMEGMQTPGTASKGKKKKKDRTSTDGSSAANKRKREEPQEEPPPTEAEKRTRKRKRKEQQPATEAVIIPDSQETGESQSQPQPTKPKKKRKPEPDTAADTTTPDDLLRTHSPFLHQTTSFYLPLSPCAHDFPLEGLCAEHISPLLLTYYPPLQGVVLAYTNPRISEHPTEGAQVGSSSEAKDVLGRSIDEYAVTYVWLTAEFLLFRPRRGCWMEGFVGLQNESMLGVVCYNYFNAVVERGKLPEGWRWESENGGEGGAKKHQKKSLEDESGYFVDGEGNKVEGRIVFRVEDFEATPGSDGSGGTVSIIGTLRTSQ